MRQIFQKLIISSLFLFPGILHAQSDPLPRFTGFRLQIVNLNLDTATLGLDEWAWEGYMNQSLYDSPFNGPGHEWTDAIEGLHAADVHPDKNHLKTTVRRSAEVQGMVRLTKVFPRAVTLDGKITFYPGPAGDVSPCVTQGPLEFIEDEQNRGFFRLFKFDTECVFPNGSKIILGYVDLMTRSRP